MADEVSVFELAIRLAASLGMVVAIILVIAKVVRARGGLRLGKSADGPRLDVLDRTSLSRGTSVAVVRVGGRGLIVGITEQSVTLLAEAPELIDRYELSSTELSSTELSSTELSSTEISSTELDGHRNLEAERTAPPVEHEVSVWPDAAPAPETTRMNFFEALREATVRRS